MWLYFEDQVNRVSSQIRFAVGEKRSLRNDQCSGRMEMLFLSWEAVRGVSLGRGIRN